MIIVKIYLGISLELLKAVCGHLFQMVPCSSLYFFSRSIDSFQSLVNVNYIVLICCTVCFQSGSLFFVYFGFLCLQVSSVSNFHPDTRGRRWSLIQTCLFSCAVGREEHCKQISLACVGSAHSVSARLGLPPLTACMLSQSTLIRLQVALRGTGPGLCALPRSKPVRFRFLGTPQRCRIGWACVLCPSQVQLR